MSENISYDNYSKHLSKITINSTSPRRTSKQLRFPDVYAILKSQNHKATIENKSQKNSEDSQALSSEPRIHEETCNNCLT